MKTNTSGLISCIDTLCTIATGEQSLIIEIWNGSNINQIERHIERLEIYAEDSKIGVDLSRELLFGAARKLLDAVRILN